MIVAKDSLDNCSTILVGKNASETGYVLMGHGEDDRSCISQIHKVPRMHHKSDKVLTFSDGTARIPQAADTWSYIWTEQRSPGGAAFADGFLNEWGVAVCSNSCISTKESTEPHLTGLGYGMRRLIAERATTAREGVELAAELMETYGYRSTRSYSIADKKEAWVIQLTEGSNYVARRLGDDEVLYIPNWLTIHEVDFSDTAHEKFYWSADLLDYAIRNGWYTPAVEGNSSDFDFAAVYQGEGSELQTNFERSDLGWKQITGAAPVPYRTFSIKAPRKFGVEDLKTILRSHYMTHAEDLKTDPTTSPHRYGICRDDTVESFIVEFTEEADLTVFWRAALKPCVSPYIPWFCGMTKSAKGYTWMGVKASQQTHLDPDAEEFRFHSDRAFWAFYRLMNTMEFDYQFGEKAVHSALQRLEKSWAVTIPEIREAYRRLYPVEPAAAKALLTDWSHAQAQKAWDWAEQMTVDLINRKAADNSVKWRKK